ALAVPDLEELAEAETGADTRRDNLRALVRLAGEYRGLDPNGTVEGFLAWLSATIRGDDTENGDAVELATFHAAKGLEWPVVYVTGLEQGLVPIGHATTPAAKAEERRLLYVAVTRAQRELRCSWAERRTFGSRTASRSPSPYLTAVEAAIDRLNGNTEAADWRARLDEQRARLGPRRPGRRAPELGGNADPEVLEALKSWRRLTARNSGVPAYVIFHDTTLAAVAELKPRDRQTLLAVPGLGPVKADRYGDQLLAVVAAHAAS